MTDAVLETFRQETWQRQTWRPRGPSRGMMLAAFGALCAIGLVVAAVAALSAALSRTSVPPAPHPLPVWTEIPKPVRIFSLEARALDPLPVTYTARRLTSGDGREDVLAFGTPAGEAAALRLTLFRRAPGALVKPAAPLFAALAREAAAADLSVVRSGLPDLMSTRFGKFEVADLTLAAPGGAPAERACSGFRLLLDKPGLTMTGLACGGTTRPITRETLGCLIDRLDVASGGEDRTLIEFFAQTELKRNMDCAGMRLGPDGLHAAWLDDKPATSRKSLRRH